MATSRYSLARVEKLLKKVVKSIDSSMKKDSNPYGKGAHTRNQRKHLASALHSRKKRLGG